MTDTTNTTASVKAAPVVDPVRLAQRLTDERGRLLARLEVIDAELAPLASLVEAARVRAEARKAIDETGLPPATGVIFDFGRGAKRKSYAGTVVAFAPAVDKLPARYKIEVGVGFDAELFVVPARDVTLPGSEA